MGKSLVPRLEPAIMVVVLLIVIAVSLLLIISDFPEAVGDSSRITPTPGPSPTMVPAYPGPTETSRTTATPVPMEMGILDPELLKPVNWKLQYERNYVVNNGQDNLIITVTLLNVKNEPIASGWNVTFWMGDLLYVQDNKYKYIDPPPAYFSTLDGSLQTHKLTVPTQAGVARCRAGYCTGPEGSIGVGFVMTFKDAQGNTMMDNESFGIVEIAGIDISGPSTVVADGQTHNLYTVYVGDSEGHPASNVDVMVSHDQTSMTFGQMAKEGSQLPQSVALKTTTKDGYAHFEFGWASVADEYVTLTAAVDGMPEISMSKQVHLVKNDSMLLIPLDYNITILDGNSSVVRPPVVRSIKLTGPGQVTANGNDTILLTAYVENSAGMPANSVKVDFLCRNNSPEYGTLSLSRSQQSSEISSYTQNGFATVWFGRATAQGAFNEVAAVIADNHSIYDTKVIDLLPVSSRPGGLDTNVTLTPTPAVLPGQNGTVQNGTTQDATGQNVTSQNGTSQSGTTANSTIVSSDAWKAYFDTSQSASGNGSNAGGDQTGSTAANGSSDNGTGDENGMCILAGIILALIIIVIVAAVYVSRSKKK